MIWIFQPWVWGGGVKLGHSDIHQCVLLYLRNTQHVFIHRLVSHFDKFYPCHFVCVCVCIYSLASHTSIFLSFLCCPLLNSFYNCKPGVHGDPYKGEDVGTNTLWCLLTTSGTFTMGGIILWDLVRWFPRTTSALQTMRGLVVPVCQATLQVYSQPHQMLVWCAAL